MFSRGSMGMRKIIGTSNGTNICARVLRYPAHSSHRYADEQRPNHNIEIIEHFPLLHFCLILFILMLQSLINNLTALSIVLIFSTKRKKNCVAAERFFFKIYTLHRVIYFQKTLFKMSLYPTLEDLKVDHMMKAQLQAEVPISNNLSMPKDQTVPSAPAYNSLSASLYPSLGDYMGLELTEETIAQNMPEYSLANRTMNINIPAASGPLAGMVAPLSGQSLGLQRAQVTNGIRELILCKDKDGKIGLRVHSVNQGIFVCLVSQDSPAALAGLRFGDQILSINDVSVAGYTMEQVHKILRNADINGIRVVVRDRPFERTVTMHKDSMGYIGFQFKNGKIIALVKDSSAARNGLLTEHQILEVNGKNVIGLKDKEITAEIENGGNVITVTIIPAYIYDHMVKKMHTSLLKNLMDHSVPDV